MGDLQAPNGSNLQLWQWVVVDDRDQIAALAKIYNEAIEAYSQEYSTDRLREGAAAAPGFDRFTDSLACRLTPLPTVLPPLQEIRAGPVIPDVAIPVALQIDKAPYAALFPNLLDDPDPLAGSHEGTPLETKTGPHGGSPWCPNSQNNGHQDYITPVSDYK